MEDNSCVRCRRYKARPFATPPIGLPNNRVTLGKAFQISGCDLAGPLFVKEGHKVWLVLFTCAVYRAIHLELVDSLSTEAFVLALRRFIARRGEVRCMYSDNETNFRGIGNAIDKLRIEREFPFKWIFNAPTAAWWGGFFERLIGLTKDLLRATLGRALLKKEELNTLLIEIEAIVNARPLTLVSENPDEYLPLTPAMFIMDNNDTQAVETLELLDEKHLTRRARYLGEIRQGLKERFKREYLGQLILKKGKTSKSIQVNDIVLIHSDVDKRIKWKLGRVIMTFPGKDGSIRVAKVKTEKGEFLRPVQKLYPVECTKV